MATSSASVLVEVVAHGSDQATLGKLRRYWQQKTNLRIQVHGEKTSEEDYWTAALELTKF
jgi:hypothetical protein